jgi:ribosome-associated toxin RatA of RatAB toxin-antitoxin module
MLFMLQRPRFLPYQWLRLAAVLGGLWWGISGAVSDAMAAPLELSATREAGRVDLRIRTTVAAPYAVIWAVLTDYDNTAQWVPGMAHSVVLQRREGGAIVEQRGSANVLFFHLAINSVVEVQEMPPDRIEVKLVRGDFKQLKGAYELKKLGDGDTRYELRWQGQLELAAAVPGFVAQPLLASNLKKSFDGLVQEMERRANAEK